MIQYFIYVDIFIVALLFGLGWGARSEYWFAKNLVGKVTNLEAQLAGAKAQLREWEDLCARLSEQVAAYRHRGMVLEERGKPGAHCHSCGMRQLAKMKLNGKYREYAFCDYCWQEIKALVKAGEFYEANPSLLVDDKDQQH